MKRRLPRSLCVFCGSSSGTLPEFAQAAAALGQLLAEEGVDLVYGGGNAGLMGRVSQAAMAAGGKVCGVIPQRLVDLVDHKDLSELVVAPDMHQRKAVMYERSEGFVVLPGGIGTLDELFEVWTWQQIGYHAKPVALLNVAGFYDQLLDFLDGVTARGFMKPVHRNSLIVASEPGLLLDALAAWTPSGETKKPERS